MPRKRYDLFVSHSKEDLDRVRQIVDSLEASGFKCFASYRLAAGVNWTSVLSEALANSSVVLLILSKHSRDSYYVLNEVTIAASNKQPVIPLRIDEVDLGPDLQIHLASAQWVDAFGRHFPEGMSRLTDSLQSRGLGTVAPKERAPHAKFELKRMWPLAALLLTLAAVATLIGVSRALGSDSQQATEGCSDPNLSPDASSPNIVTVDFGKPDEAGEPSQSDSPLGVKTTSKCKPSTLRDSMQGYFECKVWVPNDEKSVTLTVQGYAPIEVHRGDGIVRVKPKVTS